MGITPTRPAAIYTRDGMKRQYRRPHHTSLPRWGDMRTLQPRPGRRIRRLLSTQASLTRLCQQQCTGRFYVQPLLQCWGRPYLDEARLLNLHPHDMAFIRQVQLHCDDDILLFARTVVPLRNMRGVNRRILHLGSRSLGAFLFSFAGLSREIQQYTHLTPARLRAFAQDPRASGQCHEDVWGRRQVYRIQGRDLLISEIFLQPFRLMP